MSSRRLRCVGSGTYPIGVRDASRRPSTFGGRYDVTGARPGKLRGPRGEETAQQRLFARRPQASLSRRGDELASSRPSLAVQHWLQVGMGDDSTALRAPVNGRRWSQSCKGPGPFHIHWGLPADDSRPDWPRVCSGLRQSDTKADSRCRFFKAAPAAGCRVGRPETSCISHITRW